MGIIANVIDRFRYLTGINTMNTIKAVRLVEDDFHVKMAVEWIPKVTLHSTKWRGRTGCKYISIGYARELALYYLIVLARRFEKETNSIIG